MASTSGIQAQRYLAGIVGAALRYGWIDGVGKSIDEVSYMIRFMPPAEQYLERHQHPANGGA